MKEVRLFMRNPLEIKIVSLPWILLNYGLDLPQVTFMRHMKNGDFSIDALHYSKTLYLTFNFK